MWKSFTNSTSTLTFHLLQNWLFLSDLFMARFQLTIMSTYDKNILKMCSVTQHRCRRRQMCARLSQIRPVHSLFVCNIKLLVLTEQSIHGKVSTHCSLPTSILYFYRKQYEIWNFLCIALYRQLIFTFTGNNMKSEILKCNPLYRHVIFIPLYRHQIFTFTGNNTKTEISSVLLSTDIYYLHLLSTDI